jgi:uncharacterized membrane protein
MAIRAELSPRGPRGGATLFRLRLQQMDSKEGSPGSFDNRPADRMLVEHLFSHGLLTEEARDQALAIVSPRIEWALWTGRMLTAVGVSLVLSGIVYFFAFNWAKLTPFMKLGSIELVMAACLGGAVVLGLRRDAGKMLVLCASVLTGVFWAAFGQIYQTGADAYALFAIWSLMILGFALIADFAPLWGVWLVVTNTFIVLYWRQAVALPYGEEARILAILALFNLAFLGLREVLAASGVSWLAPRWTRAILAAPIVGLLVQPMGEFALANWRLSPAVTESACLGFAVLAGFFAFYRYKAPDMFVLGVVVLAASVVAECAVFRGLEKTFGSNETALFLSVSLATVALFASMVAVLRGISKDIGAPHGE